MVGYDVVGDVDGEGESQNKKFKRSTVWWPDYAVAHA
jgi:hypothetical protein